MTSATVTLSQLIPSKTNPRKAVNAASIGGLAASIKANGLLHNLVVAPQGTMDKKKFTIISGHRRYLALKLLAERGELPDDFAVPVDIREGLAKDDALRIATVENLQRAISRRWRKRRR
jgi:ParB family transcriptional regulator, chromosome partitioning protein